MAGSSPDGGSNEVPKDNELTFKDELTELRRLLFEPEMTQLDKVQERLDEIKVDVVKAEDLSQVLPEAIALRSVPDEELTEALRPTVEDAIYTSVRKDADVIATAIFPVLLPGIQKAIAAALGEMTQSLNQTLEHGFSVKSLRWRIEALLTGKSFAEIVLLRTLLYRVEQVFLIHTETGLVLQHVVAPEVVAQDAALVSAMLTALQDFVRDSFRVQQGDSLETLHFGKLTLWIEQGPKAILAGVIRGNAPQELRFAFQNALYKIHLNHSRALESFNGDTTPFAQSQPDLEACLQSQYQPKSRKPSPVLWIVLGVIVLALGAWAGSSIRDSLLWAIYLKKLNAEPGIVVTRAEKRWGKYFVSGLRDPLAADPMAIAKAANVNPKALVTQWKPYVSLEPALLAARVKQLLKPPKTVTLKLDENGILHVTGSAPHQWIVETQRRVQVIPGITQFRKEKLIDADLRQLGSSKKQIEKLLLRFTEKNLLAPGQNSTIQNLVRELKKLFNSARSLNKNVRVVIVGHANAKGPAEVNLALSQARANAVLNTLVSQGFNPINFEAMGLGSIQPLKNKLRAPKQELNRSVSFKVIIRDRPNSRAL